VTISLTEDLYTAHATATGGRAGRATTDDGLLDVSLAAPEELGGPGGATNPEQLFAAGYAACFQSALGVVGRQRKIDTSASTVTGEVTLGKTADAGFGLKVTLRTDIPGVDAETTRELVEAADRVCPYSNAIRGNVQVTLA
jgi:Ohr subfamily peroxiredoxin